MKDVWMNKIKEHQDFLPKYLTICDDHFVKRDFLNIGKSKRLSSIAVPSIFPTSFSPANV